MFYTEEDVIPAVQVAEKLFGKQYQYDVDIRTHQPQTIMTREFGKLWVGDVYFSEDFKNNLELLSTTINQRVYLVDGYDYKTAYYTTESKLREISDDKKTS